MSTELAIPAHEPPSIDLFRQYQEQAEVLLKTGFLPAHIKTPEQAGAVVLIGRELGIPMMYALRKIYVIQGTPCLAAELMLALAQRTGELDDCRIEHEGDICTVTIKRKGRKSLHSTMFSMEDARKLGLADKDNWKKQPKVMRQWRALSANLRVMFPDATGGLYSLEEIAPEITVDERGEPTEPVMATGLPDMMPKRKSALPAGGSGERSASSPSAEAGRVPATVLSEGPKASVSPDVSTTPTPAPTGGAKAVAVIPDPWAEMRVLYAGAPEAGLSGAQRQADVDKGRGAQFAPASGPGMEVRKVSELPPETGQPVASDSPYVAASDADLKSGFGAPAPLAPGALTFELNGNPVVTAGITKETILKAFKLGALADELAGKGTAKNLLGSHFGVEHRQELTEPAGRAYVAELTQIVNRANRAGKRDGK